MILTLEVTVAQSSATGYERRKVFGAEGGTIGRLPDNQWVLPDPYVSGRHAIIRFIEGAFHIEDTSRNGTYLNSPTDPIIRGRSYPIKSGDWIKIDPYEIIAHVDASAVAEKPRGNDWFGGFEQSQPEPDMPRESIEDFGLGDVSAPPKGPSGSNLYEGSPIWADYAPPSVVPDAPAEIIPSNWEDSGPISLPSPKPAPPPPPQPKRNSRSPAPPPPKHSTGLSELLQAAGIDEGSLSPEGARELGQIFRVVIAGVMDVLKARQLTKDQFGLGMTTFKPADNNPLKFSTNVDDALRQLFETQRDAKFLGPVEAFQDAFEDMRNHQIAMLAGVRVAFEAMLSEFDPDHLQEQFDRAVKKGALVSMPARLRYWELYRDWIRDMVRDADTSFRELFGDEFARAYEEQLKKLKAQGRAGKG